MSTLRTLFLLFHVAGGVLGLAVGLFAFRPDTLQFRLWLPRLCAAALVDLAIFLAAIVAVDWSSPAATPRIVFSVLIGLAALILLRLLLAFRLAAQQPVGWQMPYVTTSTSPTSLCGRGSSWSG